MEVIHRYNGAYPFFLQQQTDKTYLEVLKENLTQEQIAYQKNRYKILKEIDHANLVKLVKIYREQSTLHILYEYFPTSLDKYVEERSKNAKNNQKHHIRQLYEQFSSTVDRIIEIFVETQVKTDISIHNMTVSNIEEGTIKLFIDPSAEFHSLIRQNRELTQSEEILQFKIYLKDFYNSQKKRLIIDFDELLQKYFGKAYKVNEPNHPNFVISGSKLVFINQPHQHIRQHKNHNMAELSHQKQQKGQNKSTIRNSPNKVDKAEEIKRELKQKNMKKIDEIKSVLSRFQNKTPNFNQQAENRLTPHKAQQIHHNNHDHHHLQTQQHSPKKQRPRNEHRQPHENVKIQPHVIYVGHNHHVENVDSIIFKETANDKTPKNNSHKHIEQIQNEHQKLEQSRQQKQVKGNKVKRVSTLKEDNSQGSAPTHEIEHKSNDSNRHIQIKIIPNTSKSNLSEQHSKESEETGKPEEKKEEKHNKYKMKITTSHEFEIEGTGEPQIKEIEKDIMEGIKSGRITLSEFPDKSNAFKIETTEIHEVTQPINNEKTTSNSESSHSTTKGGEVNTRYKKTNDNSCSANLKTNSYQQLSSSSHSQEQKESSQHSTSVKQAFQNDHSSQTITQKIRQAKSKAEHALKQYAKRKANEQ